MWRKWAPRREQAIIAWDNWRQTCTGGMGDLLLQMKLRNK